MASTKPKTILADEILFSKEAGLLHRKTDNYVRNLLRNNDTKRFVLTESAAIKVATAIRQYPEMLVEQGIFARTPFERCWIEFPSEQYHTILAPNQINSGVDAKVGYLFDGDRVYIGAGDGIDSISLSPLIVHLHHPLSMREEIRLAEELKLSRAQLDNFYWGGTMLDILSWDIRRGLRSQHGFSIDLRDDFKGKVSGDDFLRFTAGEVRNIIGLLLMINQPSSILRTETIDRRKTMSHKGARVLMGHSIITLNLDKRSRPDRLFRPPHSVHASPRWHEVANHWCNDKVARTKGYSIDDTKTMRGIGHAHEWVQDEDGSLKFTCKICGGRRWRRIMKNGRGDRSRGIITQERIVKTDQDTEIKNHMF